MSQTYFFEPAAAFTAAEIEELTGAKARSGDSLERRIDGLAALDQAGPRDLSFLDNPKYAHQLARSRAGICLTTERYAAKAPRELTVLVVREPYRAFVTVARKLFAGALQPSSLAEGRAVAPGASVHPTARLENDVAVDPGAVIGPRAEIGSGTVVAATAVIGPGVRVGRNCAVGPGVTITNALIGDRVVIHPGCRIGQDGFGFVLGSKRHDKVPQIGRVIIQDDVEIGAGTAIDRGAIRDTIIGEGTKIDNLVQIGHNVAVGRHCVIVAQSGISGSATLEDFVVLGARVGVNNHARIGEGAQIAATSIVRAEVPAGARWGGTPAKPSVLWLREMVLLERLAARGMKNAAMKMGGTEDQQDF